MSLPYEIMIEECRGVWGFEYAQLGRRCVKEHQLSGDRTNDFTEVNSTILSRLFIFIWRRHTDYPRTRNVLCQEATQSVPHRLPT